MSEFVEMVYEKMLRKAGYRKRQPVQYEKNRDLNSRRPENKRVFMPRTIQTNDEDTDS